MAHTLIHWRFHLNEWVIDYLTRQGVFTDARILERSHWSQKRQTKYANEVVDMMVESGEVQKLWRDFHINLKAAREIKVRHLPSFSFDIQNTKQLRRRTVGDSLFCLGWQAYPTRFLGGRTQSCSGDELANVQRQKFLLDSVSLYCIILRSCLIYDNDLAFSDVYIVEKETFEE